MGFLDKFRKKETAESTYDTRDRYQLEHVILPQWLQGERGAVLIALINQKKGQFFVDLYHDMHRDDENYVCPYYADDFKVRGTRLTGGNQDKMVLLIQMPKPERVPLCSVVFILHDEKLENRRYITAELSSSGEPMLCEWKNGSHLNYGEYSESVFNGILMQ